jgi:hypothetical protein
MCIMHCAKYWLDVLLVDEGIAYAIQTIVQVQLTIKEPFFTIPLLK